MEDASPAVLPAATDIYDRAHADGSDSGVDIASTLNTSLQRALSNNSGGYASSNGALDESYLNENASCDSSMISYSSDLGEPKVAIATMTPNSNYECTSENGSESSSVTGDPSVRKLNVVKNKVAIFEPQVTKSEKFATPNRPRMSSVTRASSVTKAHGPVLQTRDRARSRDKVDQSQFMPPTKTSAQLSFRWTPGRKPVKPDTLPAALNASPNVKKIQVQRTPSLTRARTPGTPSDDGRWPSTSAARTLPNKKVLSLAYDTPPSKSKPPTSNIYGTLPRRRKQKSVEDLKSSRSSSVSRDTRMSTSVLMPEKKKAMPSKVRIYHETGSQTALTSQDVENAFAGIGGVVRVDEPDRCDRETQSDIRDKEMELLRAELEKMRANVAEKSQKIASLESQLDKERDKNTSIQRELHVNSERVIGLLEMARGTPSEDEELGCDSFLMLESKIQMSGHELLEKQGEINKLRRICKSMQKEVERLLVAQDVLSREKATIEGEWNELQDFLQNEKAAMCEALKESEAEFEECKQILEEKKEEVKVLRDECRHLVRLNEQRRQENKTMQSKYAALEAKCKEQVSAQSTAVSGASMALTGLHNRLDNLVEQLISSYNISEQELEDVVFHNEAYANSGSSREGSPNNEEVSDASPCEQPASGDGSLSPQRNRSFITAVISAIRLAATSTGKKVTHVRPKKVPEDDNGGQCDESENTEMLDSETEPCLMMDNVLEDAPMPDSHSHNMISSQTLISQIDVPSDFVHAGDESLQNLSQAIANRQQMELQINKVAQLSICDDTSCHDSVGEMPSLTEFYPGQNVVDQVIEVDNLVTKLLKVLRLIQMDNDNCIQLLIVDKNKLQLNKEELLERIKDVQNVNAKLHDELMDATQELMLKGVDLTTSKVELQRHRNEIDRLNQDICQLSTLCSPNITNTLTAETLDPDASIDEFFLTVCDKISRKEAVHCPNAIIGKILYILRSTQHTQHTRSEEDAINANKDEASPSAL